MKQEINPILRRAVRMALLVGGTSTAATLAPSIADAQTAATTSDQPATQMTEVVVTGTRIASPSLDAISPVTAVSSEEFKETLGRRQANVAVALLKLGAAEHVWKLLKHSPDPRARSYVIHWLSPRGGDPQTIVR